MNKIYLYLGVPTKTVRLPTACQGPRLGTGGLDSVAKGLSAKSTINLCLPSGNLTFFIYLLILTIFNRYINYEWPC